MFWNDDQKLKDHGAEGVSSRLLWKIRTVFLVVLLLVSASAGLAVRYSSSPLLAFGLSLAAGLLIGWFVLDRMFRSARRVLSALRDGIRSFKDRDYTLRLAVDRSDELGELLSLYNELGDLLREERGVILQKELLLDNVLQSNPTAVVLTNQRGKILYTNRAADQLFPAQKLLAGRNFQEIVEGCPEEMREVLHSDSDALFHTQSDDDQETYHLSRRTFRLNGQVHTLYLVQRLTRELSRQEVEVWKKAIRVMSHEVNNSMAPVSSLVHSARILHEKGLNGARMVSIFDAIGERVEHLKRFLEGYACFARLPKPDRQPVNWKGFLTPLQEIYSFEIEEPLPMADGWFDRDQMEQVLINLLKNAHEASADKPDVTVRVLAAPQAGCRIQVMDRGSGMEEAIL
ncbi:MAG: ATP-binding protein, partial [Acidobacteria bacterium]